MPGTIITTQRKRRRLVRSLAFVLTTAAATVAAVGAGMAPTTAQADPGDTRVPIGSSQLVQSEDIDSLQLPMDTQTVTLHRDDDFSACLGEGNSWTAVLKGSPKPISLAWTRRGDHDARSSDVREPALYETIAQARDEAQAERFAATLVTMAVEACRTPSFDFHYGKPITNRVGSGVATWALSYRGSSRTPDGGVVVIRKGSNVGLVQFSGEPGPAGSQIESVAKIATDRLIMSS